MSGFEGRDPIDDFNAINRELAVYSEALSHRPQIVAANKTDIADPTDYIAFRENIKNLGLPYFEISGATTAGVSALVKAIAEKLQTLPSVIIFEADYVPPQDGLDSREVEITVEDSVYYVQGRWLERLIGNINFSDYESRMYFDKIIKDAGIYDKLEELGIGEGDTVDVEGYQFDYVV